MPNASGSSYSAPGKVFLLGEYAALAGLPALVAACGPRFKLTVGGSAERFAPESPVGRLLEWAGAPSLAMSFEDPHAGAGGFGASTAQFALAYFALADARGWSDETRRWENVWKLYRELTGQRPSGADLVSQWRGGVSIFDARERKAADVWPLFDWSGLLVFSAAHLPGRKIATHEHLATLAGGVGEGSALAARLEAIVAEGMRAIGDGSAPAFGRALESYADALAEAGLESEGARDDRQALSRLPGVLGCKGAGAGLSDAVIVLMQARSGHRETVIAAAQARGLKLVVDGLAPELGVSKCP